MTHAVARGVDAAVVGQARDKKRTSVHLVAVVEFLAVEVAENLRPHGVGLLHVGIAQHDGIGVAVGKRGAVVAHGESVQLSGTTVAEVVWHHERDVELSADHAVAATEDGLLPVVESEHRVLDLRAGVAVAGDELLGIEHQQAHRAFHGIVANHVSSHSCRLAGIGMRRGAARDLSAIDGVDDHGPCWLVKGDCRVAKQGILQLVHGRVAPKPYHLVLGEPLRLANGRGLAVCGAEHVFHESLVEDVVVVLIHCARGAEDRHGTAARVCHGRHADVILHAVERHDVARGEHPQGQVLVAERLEVVKRQNPLVGHLVGAAVTIVVHDERAFRLLPFYDVGHFRVSVSRGRCHLVVSVPHHLAHLVCWTHGLQERGHLVGVAHVNVVVAVVAHHHDGVFPVAGVVVFHIFNGFVHHHLGVFLRVGRQSAHRHVAHVELAGRRR